MTTPLQEAQNRIRDLEEEIVNLKSQLAAEKVSNLEFDISNKDTFQKCEKLKTELNQTLLENNKLVEYKLQLEAHINTIDIKQRENQIKISEYKNTIHQQNISYQHLLEKQSQEQKIMDNDTDDEYDKYELHFGNSEMASEEDVELEEENKHMRLELLDIQMKHEELKHAHRKSVSKIEEYEIEQAIDNNKIEEQMSNTNVSELQKEISNMRLKMNELEVELKKERKKNDHLDKERRNSLAQLSQNMFKKLLDSEHEHYDQTIDLEVECKILQERISALEESKQKLVMNTSLAINELRSMIWMLGTRLAMYEGKETKCV